MQAKETLVQHLLEGTKQYVVPLFQRTYSWTDKQWQTLWKDLKELMENETERPHFMGSIVSLPINSVPSGVSKFSLIDGQQRLTTIFILLIVIRDECREQSGTQLNQQIDDQYLKNVYAQDNDYYKLLPTQADRAAYQALVKAEPAPADSKIVQAYTFFKGRVAASQPSLQMLFNTVVQMLTLVSIVLDRDDNPYLVFESLNAKGAPLSQADLIRNYVFMRLPAHEQEGAYRSHWQPMYNSLEGGENLVEFMRHFLMKDGGIVRKTEVYIDFKDRLGSNTQVLGYLSTLHRYAGYYQKFLFPNRENHPALRRKLNRLAQLSAGTAYPNMLEWFHAFEMTAMSLDNLLALLSTLENYLMRRFATASPTNELNKVFSQAMPQLKLQSASEWPAAYRNYLQNKNYPSDKEFEAALQNNNFYGGPRTPKTRLLLQSIEESFGHKEVVADSNFTVEHILPQTLTEDWTDAIGSDGVEQHATLVHRLGNLSLTAYNPELGNASFHEKRERLAKSHIQLNIEVAAYDRWNEQTIAHRGRRLAGLALTLWPYFGSAGSIDNPPISVENVTGSIPARLLVGNEQHLVKTWRSVLITTIQTLMAEGHAEVLTTMFPVVIATDSSKMRTPTDLGNGRFLETHHSAMRIFEICSQACSRLETEWAVYA